MRCKDDGCLMHRSFSKEKKWVSTHSGVKKYENTIIWYTCPLCGATEGLDNDM